MGRIHQQGDTIPQQKRWWYILHHGHFVRKVDLEGFTKFPVLEDPEYVYTCAG
jgi:hypothetical protein